MKFIYDKKIDEECHARLATCSNIFGEHKKTEVYPVDENIVEKFKTMWTPEINAKFNKGMYIIFHRSIPDDFVCYINSTPYSMDTNNGISISASSIKIMVKLICHEMNHYLFRKSKHKNTYFPTIDIEDAKEIFTVINNLYFQEIMEAPDIGWSKFWKDRYNFLTIWIKEKF